MLRNNTKLDFVPGMLYETIDRNGMFFARPSYWSNEVCIDRGQLLLFLKMSSGPALCGESWAMFLYKDQVCYLRVEAQGRRIDVSTTIRKVHNTNA